VHKPGVRRNPQLLNWLRASAIGVFLWMGLSGMHVGPAWLPVAAAVLAAAAALANAELGALVALLALSIPIMAANMIVGVVAFIALIAAEHFLGGGGATNFMVFALAIVGAAYGPAWAGVVLAGYLLGAGEGAISAAASCLVVEAIGILTARESIGSVITGGAPHALLSFDKAPATLLSSAWIAESFKGVSTKGVNAITDTVTHIGMPTALLAQMSIWALAAVAVGLIMKRASMRPPLWHPLAAVTVGVLIAWAGDSVLRIGFALPSSGNLITLASSLVVALAFTTVRELVFGAAPVEVSVAARNGSLAAEDADVDELLRLIATAEDKLATQHTSQRIVLITDMKSFSRMTEEDGSVASAKAIQRHRDILVPIISANNGCGKSTGGDGVVAAFETASDALKAAIEGQRALAAHNTAHPNEREIWVRMGLASGEVVLDKHGRPFIGAGLNLAARVMNLADGGQIFVAADIAEAATGLGTSAHSFGLFDLKNIGSAEIAEVLWADGQQPKDPRGQAESA
jgi:class 3 adenylate cyclase